MLKEHIDEIIRESGLHLREATMDDARMLLEWRNDPEVRAQSFHEEVIVYEDHVQWLKTALADDATAIFILMNGENTPVGQLRLHDEEDRKGIFISYSIDRDHRGKGFGNALIAMVDDVAQTSFEAVPVLCAEVKPENAASRRIFEQNGFACTEEADRCLYTKPLAPAGSERS